jgi:pimeloyl-ACP methyl ester carboxylesterase
MQLEVNGTRLWFDVDGPALVPDGSAMMARPTIVLVHGGPGTYDHSYFKPWFGSLREVAQVVYLDLRDHGRSARHDAAEWSFELSADDVRAFCDALDIVKPVVFGHSMGGFVAMLYAARHPAHPGGVILQSTLARFDLERLVGGFRRVAGDEIAELAERDYGGDPISNAEWARVFAAFGPHVPSQQALARRLPNLAIANTGMDLMRRFDVIDQLRRITCPTLVCVGELDPVTPIAMSREIVASLSPGIGRLAVVGGAGHFPWLDDPDQYWPIITAFVAATATTSATTDGVRPSA